MLLGCLPCCPPFPAPVTAAKGTGEGTPRCEAGARGGGGRQVAQAALLSRAPRIYAAATAAAGRSPTGCRSPLPRHARQAVVVGVCVTLTMVHPLWLARRPPSGCRLPLCRRLLPALAAASPWRRALPARPGRPGSLAESLPPLARRLKSRCVGGQGPSC